MPPAGALEPAVGAGVARRGTAASRGRCAAAAARPGDGASARVSRPHLRRASRRRAVTGGAAMSDETEHGRPPRILDADTEHTVKNHLAVIVGFCELLIG